MIKLYVMKKYKKIIVSTISKIAVGFGYLAILAIMIDFVYKNIFIAASVALAYLTLITFLLHFYAIHAENK